jgi:hypothetical protein
VATTTTQLAPATSSAQPLVLWHLLSLDAPTVAALWTWFLARANHIRLPLASPAAMAFAVWMLYASDRLLDARLLDAVQSPSAPSTAVPSPWVGGNPLAPQSPTPAGHGAPHSTHELEARHLFHHRHRPAFLLGIALAAVALAALLPSLDPAAVRLYLSEGALLFAWFLILHATRSAHRLPKEIAVGLFFAAASFIPTVAREPALRLSLLPDALLFAALCSLNCLFIYAWEHQDLAPTAALRTLAAVPAKLAAVPATLADVPAIGQSSQTAHPTTRLALGHLTSLAVSIALAAAALALLGRVAPTAAPSPIAAACALSAALLLVLDRNRRRLSPVALRAAADLALLTPLTLLPFLR